MNRREEKENPFLGIISALKRAEETQRMSALKRAEETWRRRYQKNKETGGGKSKEIRSKRGKKDTSNKNTRKEKNKDTGNLEINLINVNGLTKEKFAEIEKTFLEKELNILCMTETQLVQDEIHINNNIEYFTAMREVNENKRRRAHDLTQKE